jgi:peptidoglycan/xylan/chitin deacetylase (PgdA/CDA1 family)
VPSSSRRTFLLGGLGLLASACAAVDESPAAPRPTNPPTPAPTTVTTQPVTTAPARTTTTAPGPRFVTRGPTSGPGRVALTFHTAGPLDLATRLVEQLQGTPATCFVVGSWLDANPGWAARLRGAGLELANHTHTHPDANRLDTAALTADIVRCRTVLTRLTGSPGRFFRPSGTSDGLAPPPPSVMAAAEAAGYTEVVGFGADPLDYRDPGADTVVRRTVEAVAPGTIVSLHFGHPGTVTAVPGILRGLQDRGLLPVTLSALLG